MLIVFLKIKTLGENERFAVITFGKYQKLIPPGLHFKISGSEVIWLKLSLGQLGSYLGDGIAEFKGMSIPVNFDEKPTHGVKISGFKEDHVWVSPSKTISVSCEKCGHQNEVAA